MATTTTTVGVAINLPEPWGSELTAARVAAGDPVGAYVPAHITLLGPTEVDAGALPAIERELTAVAAAHPAFTVGLQGTGTFRPLTQVVFVVVAAGIDECERLHRAVRAATVGDAPALQFPYHPHVTVAHNVPAGQLDAVTAELASYTATIGVDGFTLFEHDDSGRWRPHAQYRLSPRPCGVDQRR